MKNNTIKNSILNEEMKAARTPNEAWNNGDQYFLATEAEAYKKLSKDRLIALLRSSSNLQKETGHIQIFEDPTMPADARVDIIHKPSYAIAAIAIYAKVNCPEIYDESLDQFLLKLLEGAFHYGIIGHGIDSEETVRRTLLMLCKAGLKPFLDSMGNIYPTFNKVITRHMDRYMSLAKEIDESHIIVTANGFSNDSINHLVKELIAYWNGNTRPVFVYGTLMKGARANDMLSSGEFAGHFLLKDHAMYNLGSYPGIKPCLGESVFGELYFVNPDVMCRLDEYECEGSLYVRNRVTLSKGLNSSIVAEAYIYNRDVNGCKKMREAWNAQEDDLVWYAGYGSNLSSDRFSCYISGGTCSENGKTYRGSSDHTPPRAVETCSYHGSLYFGNSSPSWGGCGVAFYNPNPKDKDELVYMKRYLISRGQLHDVMDQEGPSANWYGRLVCLEVDNNGIPVYTCTSETLRTENAPSQAYIELISKALTLEFNLTKKKISSYLRNNNHNTLS